MLIFLIEVQGGLRNICQIKASLQHFQDIYELSIVFLDVSISFCDISKESLNFQSAESFYLFVIEYKNRTIVPTHYVYIC